MRDDLARQLRELLDRARESWPLPGVSLCLVDRDTELVVIDAGWADLDRRTPVGADTRFQIGSISKSFTGMVLAALADEGRVDLTAPVTRYLFADHDINGKNYRIYKFQDGKEILREQDIYTEPVINTTRK